MSVFPDPDRKIFIDLGLPFYGASIEEERDRVIIKDSFVYYLVGTR